MRDRYDRCTKAQLGAELRLRGLPDKGLKAVLIERLRDDDRRRGEEETDRGEAGTGDADEGERETDRGEAGTGDADEGERETDRDEAATGDSGEERAGGDEDQAPAAEGPAPEAEEDRAGGGHADEGDAPQPPVDRDGAAGPRRGDVHDDKTGPPSDRGGAARLRAPQVAAAAARALRRITGRVVDSVSGLRPTDGGWRVTVEVVEHARVPLSTDLLATYEVDVDTRGRLVGYARRSRYHRNQAADEARR